MTDKDIISKVSRLSILEQLSQTIYVESNPAIIEFVEIIKDGNNIKYNKKSKSINLETHKITVKKSDLHNLIISDELDLKTVVQDSSICDSIAFNLNFNFIEMLDNLSDTNKKTKNIKFFKKSIWDKICCFFKKDDYCNFIKTILNYSKDSTWMIVSPLMYSIIKKDVRFYNDQSVDRSLIYRVGKLGSISVYLDPNSKDNSIYFGKYDDFSIIMNRNASVKEIKCFNNTYTEGFEIEVQYGFISCDGNTVKRIIVE